MAPTLRLISRERAERILAKNPDASDLWLADYPLDDELDALRFFLASPALSVESAVFGLYSVHQESSHAVGGIGFFGPPDLEGAVTIGYGVVPSARGRGIASQAVAEIVEIARWNQVRAVHAVTDLDNLASQRVLLKNGFTLLRSDEAQAYFENRLAG
ncbi:GNAT family N-acetyltransferase [Psychromicrobium sp. YIM B11713]|uniref:GNAT family N-acetyltransferase n=1 Tax=Psychromicrobium sp. YIM B11713 TaxID=3145233 RepID=UPI00374EA393